MNWDVKEHGDLWGHTVHLESMESPAHRETGGREANLVFLGPQDSPDKLDLQDPRDHLEVLEHQ